MKKIKLLTGLSTLSILGLSSLPLTSCNKVQQFTIHFNTNDGSAIADIKVDKDSTITKPADPVKEGYAFLGWYSDEGLTTEFDFNTKITSDLTLYAKWIEAQEISKDKLLEMYTASYNNFVSSTFEYQVDDVVCYYNGQQVEISYVDYKGTTNRRCTLGIRGSESFWMVNIAGETPASLEEALEEGTDNKYYRYGDDMYIWLANDELEAIYAFNKYNYSTFIYSKILETGETYYSSISYLKEPTK